VFAAALAGLPATSLRIVSVDPAQGAIWTDKSASAFSWGERVTVYVYQGDQGQAAVVVDSHLKFGLFSWGAHKRNHQTVFEAIERGLGVAPGPADPADAPAGAPPPPPPAPRPAAGPEQAPAPYPCQQPERPAEPEPPPGATRF
jgi:hypothetical protein